MNKFLNIFLDIFIILLVCYIVITLIFTNNPFKTPIENFEGNVISTFKELHMAQVIVDKYVRVYARSDYESFEKILDSSIIKDISVYDKVKEDMGDIYSTLNYSTYIINVKKGLTNNYLIEYSLDGNKDHKNTMLVKIDESRMTYLIYYDSILAKY